MGGLFGGGGGGQATPSTTSSSAVGPYPDDNVRRAPIINSPTSREAERRTRSRISSRSGRASTNLAGSRSYVNSLLGDVG